MASDEASSQASSRNKKNNIADMRWMYNHPLKEDDTNNDVCMYCGKTMKGGINRAMQHLVGKASNVTCCLAEDKKKQGSIEISYVKGCLLS